MQQPSKNSTIQPRELLRILAEELQEPHALPDVFSRGLSVNSMLAKLCLEDAGFVVEVLSRQAMAHRNDDDNLFRQTLTKEAPRVDGLQALLDRVWSQRTKEQVDFFPVEVHAFKIKQGDQESIMDWCGNENELDILAYSSRERSREPGYYKSGWQDGSMLIHDMALETLRSSPEFEKIKAACFAKALSNKTKVTKHASPRRI